ncbi:acyltransferase [Rhodococcus sp. IEGM 1381]|uniref:acyltransferase family protein n=1 Tax=Rhodococcus sp. IEGM 1381 TaxID=3047085 RepID=UPI0024B64389|nr:acyltransferase [Rhodococcus sp. IEGM 1381]MDI9894243.1 acyltransferase [Rhodococcus sp. IEGM 1381]
MEGLRGIAAVTVLVGHVSIHLARSVDKGVVDPLFAVMGQGLTLFFALSGFLLYLSFARAIVTGQRFPRIDRFFENRGLRIFPAYIVILLLVSLVFGVAYANSVGPDVGPEGAESSVGYMTNPIKLLANATMLHTLFPSTIKTGLGVSWSLTVELIFYLILRVLAIIAYRLRRTGISSVILALAPPAVMLGIGLVGKAVQALTVNPVDANERFYLEWGGNWTAVFARSFLVHADLFAFGMLAAVMVAFFNAGVLPASLRQYARWAGLVAGLAVVAIGRHTVVEDTVWAALGGAIIMFVALPNRADSPSILARVFEFIPFRYVGEVSYSLYLWHIPVIWFLARHGWVFPETLPGFYGNLALVFVVAVGLASITYYGIERPALKLKRNTVSTRSGSHAATSAP